jgi:hypothetical protein
MPGDIAQCPQSIVNVPSDCRIASIVPNHAMILPNDANPSRMEFSERTGMAFYPRTSAPNSPVDNPPQRIANRPNATPIRLRRGAGGGPRCRAACSALPRAAHRRRQLFANAANRGLARRFNAVCRR